MRRTKRHRLRALEAENARLKNRVRVLEIALHVAVTKSEPVLVDL